MSKLSDELKQFQKDLLKLPAADREKVYAAVRASLGPVKSSRKLGNGETVDTRDVDFTLIDAAIPADLRQDWRQIQRSLNDAAKKHGNQWADESFAYILTRRVLPQPTPGEQLIAATPGLLEAIIKQIPTKLPAPPAPTIDVDELAAKVAEKLKPQPQP